MLRRILGGVAAAGILLPLASAVPTYAEPFLCPIVGDGVLNADGHNGDNGVVAIGPPAGTSLLPGSNQAGPHANVNAYNAFGGPGPGNAPGTPGFTPIWNP